MRSLSLRVSSQKILLGEPQRKKPQQLSPHRQRAKKPPELRSKLPQKKKPRKPLSAASLNKARLQQGQSLQLSFRKAHKNSWRKTLRCNVKALTCPPCVVLSVRALWKDWLALAWALVLVRGKVLQPSARWLWIKTQGKTTKICSPHLKVTK